MATAIRWGAVAVLVTAALTVAACGRGGGEAETDADSPLDGYLNEIYGEYDPDAPTRTGCGPRSSSPRAWPTPASSTTRRPSSPA